jgi:hypothetical protein
MPASDLHKNVHASLCKPTGLSLENLPVVAFDGELEVVLAGVRVAPVPPRTADVC